MKAFFDQLFEKKIKQPLLVLLKQGVSPEKLALSLAVGVVISFCPLFGLTTALCILAGTILRLNHIAVQIANYSAYPLQLLLILPFIRMGEWLFSADPVFFELAKMRELLSESTQLFFQTYATSLFYASVAWAVVALPAVGVTYSLFKPLLYLAQRLWVHRGRRRG